MQNGLSSLQGIITQSPHTLLCCWEPPLYTDATLHYTQRLVALFQYSHGTINTGLLSCWSDQIDYIAPHAGLSYWERDRMYELGFQDMVDVLGRSMSLQEAGQWGALAALVAGLLGLAASLQAAQAKVRLWAPITANPLTCRALQEKRDVKFGHRFLAFLTPAWYREVRGGSRNLFVLCRACSVLPYRHHKGQPAVQSTAQQRAALLKQTGKARQGLEFQLFQRNLKNSGALDPGTVAVQLQSSLEASATAHKSLSAMLDSAKQVGTLIEAVHKGLRGLLFYENRGCRPDVLVQLG